MDGDMSEKRRDHAAIFCALLAGALLGASCLASAGALALAWRQEARADVHERALGDVVRVINASQKPTK